MRFISYFMEHVLPAIRQEVEGSTNNGLQLDALKVLAELFQVPPAASDCQPLLDPIFEMLLVSETRSLSSLCFL